jgi:hypothetical protein
MFMKSILTASVQLPSIMENIHLTVTQKRRDWSRSRLCLSSSLECSHNTQQTACTRSERNLYSSQEKCQINKSHIWRGPVFTYTTEQLCSPGLDWLSWTYG